MKYNPARRQGSADREGGIPDGGCGYLPVWRVRHGIGMSKAFQSRMFEPFSQEQTESPSEYRGTGLGPSIVKAMIDQMGGQITVDSRKGEGTDIVWTLTFPIDREYRETGDPEAPAELDLTGKRILAAEDNALNAEIVEMMLEEAGARVTLVDNGKALVEAFAASLAGSFLTIS